MTVIRTARLTRCLTPQSIAVVGGDEAAQVIRQCRKLNFAGELWAVNPARYAAKKTLEGLQCYESVDALPAAPDAAFVAIPAAATIDAVAALSRAGAGGAVCYASGFRETGGDDRHRRLVAAAGAMPVVGPNCYGFLNLTCGAALWPDYHGAQRIARGVAIFSQSGNVSLNISMQRRLLPLAWLVTLGNQAVVGVAECIAAALASDDITAIGIHVEGLTDLPRIATLAVQAREKNIPIIALKVGRSEIGARITVSHTATLAGESALYDEFFSRLGIGTVDTPQEFLEALKLASIAGIPRGNRITSLSCSGGEATLVADLASTRALQFPPPDDAHRHKVQATLNEYVRVDNPLDYHTFIWGDRARMTETFTAMLSGGYDLSLFVLDIPHDDAGALEVWLRAVHAFIAACDNTGARAAMVASLAENLPADVGALLMENNIAPLHGLEAALAATEAVCAIGMAWAKKVSPPVLTVGVPENVTPSRTLSTVTLNEAAAKTRLAEIGLPVPRLEVVDSADAAVAAAARLGYPVVMKAVADHIAHKTELDAVAVDLRDEQQIRARADALLRHGGKLLVEEMVTDVVAELLLGIGYDLEFGHYLIIGFGGELVELIGDRQLILLPADAVMIKSAIAKLKTAPLLHGHRARPPADVDAVVDCALRLTQLITADSDFASELLEVEINPLLVKACGAGAVVADALMTLRG